MPPRVDSVALLERTMQMIREAHADWDEDQVLEDTFLVMNLQPNTNQAEKIPRSVLSTVSQIVKLNENNWAIWEPMFMDCIRPIKNARCILTGEIPSGHTNYDEELDSHLLGLILSSCDHGSTSHIDTYTVREQGEEEQLGVRGLAPETQVGLSGYSATIKLHDDSGWRLCGLLPSVLSISGPLVCYEPPSDVKSTFFIEYCAEGPSSTTPVLLSCVDSFDTAPPPQDLLASFLYTAPSL
ncbi:uncharacterized protein UHOD_11378 [Ustilago sp. UG-2017b]|nr:uncharacterized protein UHOD_11378 [Ustilago sp. UG-2017b]